MPRYKFGDADNVTYQLVPEGDYPFEIIDAEEAILSTGKTKGSDILKLKIEIYADEGFSKPLSSWHETLIFHPSCYWKIDTFVKCVAWGSPKKDDEVELLPPMMIGLRGWCRVGLKPGMKDPNKEFNYVSVWYTDRTKLNPRIDLPPLESSSSKEEDDVPW